MSISNNKLFFCNSIPDGWTKKEWALNLIPLGSIAFVAYEIGSACLSSKERTAKISEDFFKSPIQTTIKKIAQCLWVPYQVPTVLEAATCILAEYSRSKKRLFSDNPWTFTTCQENVRGSPIVVGGFEPAGLHIDDFHYHGLMHIGVAALRKFSSSTLALRPCESSKAIGSWSLSLW
jgi:hypothetical protein